MSRGLVVLLMTLLTGYVIASRPAPCAIDVQPKVAMAGRVSLATRVTIERGHEGRHADLTLIGPSGFIRASQFPADVRTQWVLWRDLDLADPGAYVLNLHVTDGCVASTPLLIGSLNAR